MNRTDHSRGPQMPLPTGHLCPFGRGVVAQSPSGPFCMDSERTLWRRGTGCVTLSDICRVSVSLREHAL